MRFQYQDGTAVTVNCADAGSLLAQVAARLAAGQGFALATINVDHLDQLRRDAAFRAAYAAQDFVVADGNPIVWLSRLAGRPVSLAPGSDLVLPLARVAAAAGVSVALIGSTGPALDRAAEALRAAVPGLRVALTLSPGFPFDPDGDEAGAVLDRLAASGAGLAFLALGAPRQERLAARGRGRVPGCGFASVGAGLDFLAGTQRRAPRIARMAKAEWLWRMLSDPRRLARRYGRGFALLPAEAVRAWRLRRNGGPDARP
ncbi:WecB/TagA/CpsF family glycosyltransferase [Paracoccus luteus]|uniref:WecB/TagA/CpsF family glycosyltransferase n=1 Tax=Paracoccus luteus TaxID=2508543 RepID=UPI00106F8F54|nr:WecB/TagA/CpsF family glycosyltransferase [Paracoccus luteus]